MKACTTFQPPLLRSFQTWSRSASYIVTRPALSDSARRRSNSVGVSSTVRPAPGVGGGEFAQHERLGIGMPAQRSADPRRQLGRREGLDNVVGRARLQRPRDGLVALYLVHVAEADALPVPCLDALLETRVVERAFTLSERDRSPA